MSTAAIPVHVALVDKTGKIKRAALDKVAGALNEQVQADFAPVWKVKASVGSYSQAPAGTWAVIIENKLDAPGALGYHTDVNGQPVSYVEYASDWPVTASHETLEMLADPFGNRMHSARLPEAVEDQWSYTFGLKTLRTHVHYLLEVCDPCEETSYAVGGVKLSDFLLPPYYRSTRSGMFDCSHANGVKTPREVADGGYVSFMGPDNVWFQVFAQGGGYQVQKLGTFDKSYGSLRAFADAKAREYRSKT